MTTGLTPAQQAATLAPHRQVAPLVEAYFRSGTLMFALAPFDITTAAGTYIHTGPLMQIAAAAESGKDQQGIQITMSGLDPAIGEIVATEAFRGRIVRILKAYLAVDSNAVIGTPTVKFVGRIRGMSVTEDNQSATVAMVVEHYEIELTKPAPLRWNDADQQRLYPGDQGCQYAVATTTKQIIWPSRLAQGG